MRPDVDLAHAVENLVDGSYFNSGQCCCGIERIYVHADVYDKFVAGFVDLTKQYVLDDPLDPKTTLGPMAQQRLAATVRDHIGEAVHKGARALIDTKAFARDSAGSTYVAPQALVDVDHAMKVMMEETFGPVVGIMKVRDDEEAIRLMNDSPYGLTASIWTRDMDAAERIGSKIETGTVYMNRCDYLDPGTGLDRREGYRPRRDVVADRLRDAHPPEELSLASRVMELRGNWNYPTTVRFGAGRISELGRGREGRRHEQSAVRHRSGPRENADDAEGGGVAADCDDVLRGQAQSGRGQCRRRRRGLSRRAGMTAWWPSAAARRSMSAS